MTKHFIDKQYDVEELDAKRSFGRGEKRGDYADAWQDTGNVVLVGLAGSGKSTLAALLSERTGLNVLTPANPEEAVKLLGGSGRIIVLGDELVEDVTVQPVVHGAGKVFYLMTDSQTLSSRVAEGLSDVDAEQLWRDMSARLAVMEPQFYSVLHFILQAGRSPEELLDDTLEKVAF